MGSTVTCIACGSRVAVGPRDVDGRKEAVCAVCWDDAVRVAGRDNVVEYDWSRGEPGHLAGTAACQHCGDRWPFVAPIGAALDHLDCPSCGLAYGVASAGCAPDEGKEWWTCRCGGHVFFIERAGKHVGDIRCYRCGLVQRF